ncbi:unnamed protein product [Vitrella brassicaformis CCMP3155]|uniref:Uncharacterized protein n=1 Tax=Vitrella brassicaformis (strain CCMP3155) TaxID=1169540 RepID=A0A0G4GT76_VITBC|nr:unnamed protein product [Vitrella brassicaformis CCMP3155]|eukprot:CEM33867.1 unnamed protein product [Vitrella brassicaformis CCMP3155]
MAHRLVTHDGSQLDGALVERLQFFGHTLFREAISRQWQRWTPEQRASVKAVLLDVLLRVDAHGISWTERVAQQVESEEMDTETDKVATSIVSIGAVFVDKYGRIKNACGHALRSTAALAQDICAYLVGLLAKLGQRVIASAAFQQGRKVDIEPLILSHWRHHPQRPLPIVTA